MVTFSAARGASLALLLLALAAGCSREQPDWHAAEAANTSEAYGRFIEQHADSELSAAARARIAQLQEQRDWQHADALASLDAYRGFLTQHPSGKWAEQARIRIEGFSLGSAPRTEGAGQSTIAAARSGVRALQLTHPTPLAVPPAETTSPMLATQTPPPAATSPVLTAHMPPPAAASAVLAGHTSPPEATEPQQGYGIQLGAFGSPSSADREWQRLQGRFDALHGLSPRIVLASSSAGPLYRLQAPAAGEAQARALCDSLKQQAQACVPVIPP